MTEINMDKLDELFVCSHCGHSIASMMPSFREYKRRTEAAKAAIEEAITYLNPLIKSEKKGARKQ